MSQQRLLNSEASASGHLTPRQAQTNGREITNKVELYYEVHVQREICSRESRHDRKSARTFTKRLSRIRRASDVEIGHNKRDDSGGDTENEHVANVVPRNALPRTRRR
jgi:hypothetical protein